MYHSFFAVEFFWISEMAMNEHHLAIKYSPKEWKPNDLNTIHRCKRMKIFAQNASIYTLCTKWWDQMGCNKFNHLLLNDKIKACYSRTVTEPLIQVDVCKLWVLPFRRTDLSQFTFYKLEYLIMNFRLFQCTMENIVSLDIGFYFILSSLSGLLLSLSFSLS